MSRLFDSPDWLIPQGVAVRYAPGAAALSAQMFGRVLADTEVAQMIGALDDAEIAVSLHKRFSLALFFESFHPWLILQERTLRRDNSGGLYFHNDFFTVRKPIAPKQLGLFSFLRQVVGARAQGLAYLATWAAGDYSRRNELNGYFTWARFGYDAPLVASDRARLPRAWAGVATLNELMLHGGKDLWLRHGSERRMIFDLADDSSSLKVLSKYLAEKRIEVQF